MRVADFDFHLPQELVAQEPLERRDESRLMVVPRHGEIEHRSFRDIVNYVASGDALVLNDTRVMKARLVGKREGTGGRVELLLLSKVSGPDGGGSEGKLRCEPRHDEGNACEGGREGGAELWEVLVKPGRRAMPGTRLSFGGRLVADVLDKTPAGGRVVRFLSDGDFDRVVEEIGRVPLPPYIKKEIADPERYQTVYADRAKQASAAAPTAGLHFTRELLQRVEGKGVRIVYVTLHVGLGTFRPVKVETVEEHVMHAEYFTVSEHAARVLTETRRAGGRVFAVGTTTVRTLESLRTCDDGSVLPSSGWTTKFIYPGYRFQVVDALVTNFHLPRSTLLMLVCAFGGYDRVMSAYELAVKERYRFFSFGDAMLLL
ncbi:MAG: tRNA preQ1(34) S-adenosylmethionine ribosyltransferase-isomerase QueA [Betaproteobacteria bacterium]